jgi:predicted metal-binding membrane protein
MSAGAIVRAVYSALVTLASLAWKLAAFLALALALIASAAIGAAPALVRPARQLPGSVRLEIGARRSIRCFFACARDGVP